MLITGGATTTSAPTATSSDATVFTVTGCGSNLTPYASCPLTITPTTTANTQSSATLTVTYNTSLTLTTTITVNPKTYRAAAIWTTGTVACESSLTAYLALNIKNIGTESLVINSSNAASIITGNEGTGTSFFSWVESQNTTTCSGLTAGSTCIINAAYLCNNIIVESVVARATLTLAESSNLKLSSIINVTNYNQVGIWTWIAGKSTVSGAGSYSNTPLVGNIPPGLYGFGSIDDGNGNLYLFGGSATNYMNTLWKYNVATGYWVVLSGSLTGATVSTAISGTKTVEASGNTPTSLMYNAMTMDESGYLWVFGGMPSGTLVCNNLWRYNPTTTWWAWMTGSAASCPSIIAEAALTKGTPNASNILPSLFAPTLTADKKGSLWLFGGNDNTSYYNTMWRYSESTQLWTWIAGASGASGAATYGAVGVESASYVPSARRSVSMWYDKRGYIWVFGGYGYSTNTIIGRLNDLWRYNIATNKWAWISGANNLVGASGVSMGTQNQINSTNIIGSRNFGAGWYYNNYAYMFGGYTDGDSVGTLGYLNTFSRTKLYTN